MPSPSSNNKRKLCTVFIADASLFHCELLADVLKRDHLHVAGWAVDSDEAIACIRRQRPDVALVSSRMQDGPQTGFRVLRQIRLGGPDCRIVMLLDASEPGSVVEAFRGGAAGVFPRTRVSTDLRKCIRCVLAGEIWARHEEVGYLIKALRRPTIPHIANSFGGIRLTRREEDVVALVTEGLTNRQVAAQLGLSEYTVKNYICEIFEKLRISTRVELTLYTLNEKQRPPMSMGPVHTRQVDSTVPIQRNNFAGED